MNDFLNHKIEINDDVIYLKRMMTGSSSTRKIMFKGKIISLKGQKVEIERLYTNEWEIKSKEIDIIYPKDIVVLDSKNREIDLLIYALLPKKIYDHELDMNTMDKFREVVSSNLQDDTHTIRQKLIGCWNNIGRNQNQRNIFEILDEENK